MRRAAALAASILLCAGSPAAAATTVKGDLPRRAELGFSASEQDNQLTVGNVDASSPAARAGIQKGDRIVAVDGRTFAKAYEGTAFLQRVRGQTPVSLSLRRGGQDLTVRFVPKSPPVEDVPGTDTEYGVFRTSDGARLRTILTKPSAVRGALPALMLTQWVSCNSLESIAPSRDQLRTLAQRAGYVLIRVERSGAGDSLGPACHELDYDTEVRHYREALDSLSHHPWVDPNRIVIYGNSLGSTTAPLVAQGRNVAGVMIQGGGALTYVERMINFDRAYLERKGDVAPADIDRRMRDSVAFNVEYLLRGKTPEQIAREHPELAQVWSQIRGTGDGVHYGRPLAWHQQAARKDFLGAWANIKAPVLVVYGEFDQFETRHGHALIADTVNRLRPGSATFIEIPHADHELEIYPTIEDAYAYRGGHPEPELFLKPAVEWLKRVAAGGAQGEAGTR